MVLKKFWYVETSLLDSWISTKALSLWVTVLDSGLQGLPDHGPLQGQQAGPRYVYLILSAQLGNYPFRFLKWYQVP